MSTKHWFLLQYKPNSHRLALRNLHRQGFETFLPVQDVTQRYSTKFVQQTRPLFPGYMFVSFALDTAPWRKINSTVGVARLVASMASLRPCRPILSPGSWRVVTFRAGSCRPISLHRAISSKLRVDLSQITSLPLKRLMPKTAFGC
ncbi:MAG: transcription termination/antitermination NusG family protein [Planktomarina sp.]|nr:transcription termination/antitermination NusG family protein [Planktomarina sp.]